MAEGGSRSVSAGGRHSRNFRKKEPPQSSISISMGQLDPRQRFWARLKLKNSLGSSLELRTETCNSLAFSGHTIAVLGVRAISSTKPVRASQAPALSNRRYRGHHHSCSFNKDHASPKYLRLPMARGDGFSETSGLRYAVSAYA